MLWNALLNFTILSPSVDVLKVNLKTCLLYISVCFYFNFQTRYHQCLFLTVGNVLNFLILLDPGRVVVKVPAPISTFENFLNI